ncbi:MAG: amidohydrolase [Proteobacteria bacterium]|nr:amidohydrolase [Pseudomonadota bacterium]
MNNFTLFTRLMEEPRYDKHLYGDLAAVGQLLRAGDALRTLLTRRDWHARLVYGSDYPLPGVMPIFAPRALATEGFLKQDEAVFLSELRRYNPLLFDIALMRLLAVDGRGFDATVFASRRVFVDGSKA